MIVVDTPILVCASFKTSLTDRVLKLHETDPFWEAPVIWRSEYLKVLTFYLRKNLITFKQAEEAMETAAYFIGSREHTVSPFVVLTLLNKSKCASRDCELIALAVKLSTKLITYNNQIIRDFPDIAIKPEHYKN